MPKKKTAEKVVRLNEYHAKAGHANELRDFLISFLPLIRSFEGCVSYRILQSVEDPEMFYAEEIWTSQAVHEASVKEIPAETVSQMTQLLSRPIAGGYFTPFAR